MIQKILQDKFIKNNIIFFIGSIAVAILNYAFHPIISRMMSVEDFGEVQALISLTYITSIIGVVFGTIAVNVVANRDKATTYHIKVLSQLYKLALYVIGAFAIGVVILSPYLKSALQFESALPFLPLAGGMLIGIPFIFYGSYLKGIKDFKAMSISGIISSSSKVFLAVILIFLGGRVFGAVSAFALATLLAFFYTLHKTKGKFRLSLKEEFEFSKELKKEFSYGILVFFSLGFVTFLYTSDVIFVKYFFSPEEAGLYSGVATIARIIFFATASVAGVILPTIKIKASYEKNSAVMKKAFIIISIMGVGALSAFFLFPTVIISLLIGKKYLVLAKLLPLAGVYIFLTAVVNLFYSYFLALRDRRLIIISSMGFIVISILITLNHGTVKDIVIDYIVGSVITIVLIIGSIVFGRTKSN